MGKKLALLAIPVVLFVAGGAVMVGLRKDPGATPATPQPVNTQVISVDPPKPAARSAEVAVKLTSTPPGASVYQGDSYYGTTPVDLRLSRDLHVLTFKLDGYAPVSRNLALATLADDRITMEVALEPMAAKTAPPPTNGKSGPGKKKPPTNDQGSGIPVFE
jgi:serine/threonine-protein kinase